MLEQEDLHTRLVAVMIEEEMDIAAAVVVVNVAVLVDDTRIVRAVSLDEEISILELAVMVSGLAAMRVKLMRLS